LQGRFWGWHCPYWKDNAQFWSFTKWKIPTLKLIFNTLNLKHFYLMLHSSQTFLKRSPFKNSQVCWNFCINYAQIVKYILQKNIIFFQTQVVHFSIAKLSTTWFLNIYLIISIFMEDIFIIKNWLIFMQVLLFFPFMPKLISIKYFYANVLHVINCNIL
jgi:hypothetical protein